MDQFKAVFDNANYLQALVAALSTFAVGFAWYHKAVFGAMWMQETGMTEEKAKQGNMALTFGGTFVTSFLAAIFLSNMAGIGAIDGMWYALVLCVFIVATSRGMHFLFAQKSMRLYLIDTGHDLVSYAVMGIIIGAWKP